MAKREAEDRVRDIARTYHTLGLTDRVERQRFQELAKLGQIDVNSPVSATYAENTRNTTA